jgi:hypothetical protein
MDNVDNHSVIPFCMNYQLSIINYPFLGAILLSLTLCACGTSPQDLPVIHREPRGTPVASGSVLSTSTGSVIEYAPYAPERITGHRSVLFFAKDADPFSRLNDQRLKMLYGSGAATVSTYRVPFNESAELQLKYGVFVEDTFVVVGTGAERLSLVIHPNETELQQLVGGGNRRVGE